MAHPSESNTSLAVLIDADNALSRTANDFDPRNYGYAKLSELIAAIGLSSSSAARLDYTHRRRSQQVIF